MRACRRKQAKQNECLASGSQSSKVNMAKRFKLQRAEEEEEHPPNTTHFLDMNDDCIDTICNLLELDDLCSMSRTCRRIQSVSGDYFQRHYPNNYVRIQSFRRRSVFYKYPNERYVDDLKPFIRNVIIQEYKGSVCADYLKRNFCENLRELTLHGINCELNAMHGIQIKDHLEHLENIKFVNCSIGDIYEIFLKHCQRIKHFGIDEPIQYNGKVTWAQHTFPTLESITYFDEANTNRVEFGPFLRRNAQIKYIACKGTNVQATVMQRAKNLDDLVLCYNTHKDFARNFKLLKHYSENSDTKRIKLEFTKRLEELDHFAEITSIQKLHGYRGFLFENLQCADLFASVEQLKVLQLPSFGHVSQIYIKRLASCLPNLEELHFTAQDMALSFKNLLTPFCQNRNLKKIVVYSTHIMYRCKKNDITELGKVRESIEGVNKLMIYMEKEVIDSMHFNTFDKNQVILKPLSELKREIHSFDL
ncbi:uncharacterized protein LOC116349532 [Contarinia nasturtii]|uniref:uncharacterized protein LOC116349532 n=1 Tax=Contarinia nasturtii TaxID=265458 RepID=UPI0012D39D8F|nr:uncharacterized protein LOC116349532 [Contarinia nasturtii]